MFQILNMTLVKTAVIKRYIKQHFFNFPGNQWFLLLHMNLEIFSYHLLNYKDFYAYRVIKLNALDLFYLKFIDMKS